MLKSSVVRSSLPLHGAVFSGVYVRQMLHHLDDVAAGVAEIGASSLDVYLRAFGETGLTLE